MAGLSCHAHCIIYSGPVLDGFGFSDLGRQLVKSLPRWKKLFANLQIAYSEGLHVAAMSDSLDTEKIAKIRNAAERHFPDWNCDSQLLPNDPPMEAVCVPALVVRPSQVINKLATRYRSHLIQEPSIYGDRTEINACGMDKFYSLRNGRLNRNYSDDYGVIVVRGDNLTDMSLLLLDFELDYGAWANITVISHRTHDNGHLWQLSWHLTPEMMDQSSNLKDTLQDEVLGRIGSLFDRDLVSLERRTAMWKLPKLLRDLKKSVCCIDGTLWGFSQRFSFAMDLGAELAECSQFGDSRSAESLPLDLGMWVERKDSWEALFG